jgi:pimeloyl-ACP methyl ester carboxylesterase
MNATRRVRLFERRLRRRLRSLHGRYFGDPAAGLILEMESDSRSLLLTFGGLGMVGGDASFEFGSATSELPVKRLFVRDPYQSWYQLGLPRQGRTLPRIAASLRELIEPYAVDHLVAVGNSAGGYAALVFGTLLGADTVLSFAPQTILDPGTLDDMGDHRWDWRLKPLAAENGLQPEWTDLRSALEAARHTDTRYRVFFDETIEGDRLHAEHLRGLPGLQLYRFGQGGHRLVRTLRDCGALDRLLREALHLPAGSDPALKTSPATPPG